MTFGFKHGTIPPGKIAETVNMCRTVGPTVEALIYSVADEKGEIVWDNPITIASLASCVADRMMKDEGYTSNVGSIERR